MINGLLMVLLFVTSVFLILLVLIQRGRGGGLAGAFGGMGGQSAFGTKAGDLFTRITIFTAAFWIILCAFSVKWFSTGSSAIIDTSLGKNAASAPAQPGAATGKQAEPTGPGASGPATAPAASADDAKGSEPSAETKAVPATTESAAPATVETAPPAADAPQKDE
ncbi:MAG: preprotein translocase subunit SecG [Pirellulales bacterium]